ncbi:MAG: ubiquitin-conjugating enzyme E2 [Isosphaeraceae bacterium]
MHDSPRIRRLRNDLLALERLSAESSIFQFKADSESPRAGTPPNHYQIAFKGKGLCRDRGKVKIVHLHRVEIKLGASYPRTIPEIRWLTSVYHPNISEIGMVCLGGYGTHWVPSVQLDELCMMLWDMVRYHNYDIRSPYNRDAALWVANQTSIFFPTDSRPLRDLRVAQGRIESSDSATDGDGKLATSGDRAPTSNSNSRERPRTAADDFEARSAMERVGRFIQQYGGGNAGITRSEPAPASAPASRNGKPEPGPVPSASSTAGPTASETPDSDVSTLLARLGESSRQDEDVVILEDWEESPAHPTPQVTSGEEIVFIE